MVEDKSFLSSDARGTAVIFATSSLFLQGVNFSSLVFNVSFKRGKSTVSLHFTAQDF